MAVMEASAETRGDHLPDGNRMRIGINYRETCGPKELQRVSAIGNEGIFDSQGERNLAESRYSSTGALGEDGDRRSGDGKDQERNFFGDQAARGDSLPAAKRPEIEQQQRERQGHDHGLGHQTAAEEQFDQQIIHDSGTFGIADVGP